MDAHMQISTPALSRSSSTSSSRKSPPPALDFSDLPPLITPSPPSNTLLITNLNAPSIFHPTALISLRELISKSAPIHSWAPLKSFRRIVVSFYEVDDAIAMRQNLDGEVLMGDRVRVYYGKPTPIEPRDQHLHAPKSDKLFFISPPPSPPHGWEMRNEEPPNKEVHAEDLAVALSKLHACPPPEPISPDDSMLEEGTGRRGFEPSRQRSGSSTMIYHPDDHGDSPNLPAIAVEDTTASPADLSPQDAMEIETKFMHTSRPPVELMET